MSHAPTTRTVSFLRLPSTPRSSVTSVSRDESCVVRRSLPLQYQLPSACVIRGSLARKGGRFHKRWYNNLFLIEDGVLFICWDLTSHFLIDAAVPLCNILACNKAKKDPTQFVLIYNGVKNSKGNWRTFKLDIKCADEKERDIWVTQLLEMRETARALNSDLVDRSKAYEALQRALEDVRKGAAQAIGATLAGAISNADQRDLCRAFNMMKASPVSPRGVFLGHRGSSSSPRLNDAVEKEVQRRLISNGGSRRKSSADLRSLVLGPDGFAAANTLEGLLRLTYWLKAHQYATQAHVLQNMYRNAISKRQGGSSSFTKKKDVRRPSTTTSPFDIGSTPRSGTLTPSPGRENHVFVTNLWQHHSEMMAKDILRFRTTRLVTVLQEWYRKRLTDAWQRMETQGQMYKMICSQRSELLLHLIKHRETMQQIDRKHVWIALLRYMHRGRQREDGLLGLLYPAKQRQQRLAVRLWYTNVMKLSDRDLTAVTKLVSAMKKARLRVEFVGFRALDRNASEAANLEMMQVAQNLTQVNTKILASFNQIPISRAVVQLAGAFKNIEQSSKRNVFNRLVMNLNRHNMLTKLSLTIVAILRNVETRISVRDPFNQWRAAACRMNVASAHSKLERGLNQARWSVKICACTALARYFHIQEARILQTAFGAFRRNAFIKSVAQEKTEFLNHYSRIVKHGQRSAVELFTIRLVHWAERVRISNQYKGWIALYDNFDADRRRRYTQKEKHTIRLWGLIDRLRIVALSQAWKEFKTHTHDVPKSDELALHAVTQAIASAEKTAAQIELSKKIEQSVPPNKLINELLEPLEPDVSPVTPPSKPIDEKSLAALRKELSLITPRVNQKEMNELLKDAVEALTEVSPQPPPPQPPPLSNSQSPSPSPLGPQQQPHNIPKAEDAVSDTSLAMLLQTADQFLAASQAPLDRQDVIGNVSDCGRIDEDLSTPPGNLDWSEITAVLGEFKKPAWLGRQRKSPARRPPKTSSSSQDSLSTVSTMSQESWHEDRRKVAFVRSVGRSSRSPPPPAPPTLPLRPFSPPAAPGTSSTISLGDKMRQEDDKIMAPALVAVSPLFREPAKYPPPRPLHQRSFSYQPPAASSSSATMVLRSRPRLLKKEVIQV